MTPSLSTDRGRWLIDGRPGLLACGELHYFRIPPGAWAARLRDARESGLTAIATLVPWSLHEPEEGRADFAGALDLDRFLGLCDAIGLQVLLRPGPYQYSEMAFDGLPAWLFARHPEIRAQRLDGTPLRDSSVSYLHPAFLAAARRHLDRAMAIARRHPCLTAVQLDNELLGIHDWFGGPDYHRKVLGVGRDDGRWPRFAAALRGDLAGANAAYGTDATAWSGVRPRPAPRPGCIGDLRLQRDYHRFTWAVAAEYLAEVAGWIRAAGFAGPLTHNAGSMYMDPWFAPAVERLGPEFVLGSDHYYNLNLDWDQNHPTPKYASKCAWSLAQLAAHGAPATVFELPGGSCSDWPPISARDAACAAMVNLAYGMQGWNIYVFAGGENPPGAGVNGRSYDYGAAVAIDGARRELFAQQRAFHAFTARHPWLAGAALAADVRIALVADHAGAPRGHADRTLHPCSTGDAATMARKGPWITAACAGLSPDWLVLDGRRELPTDLPLVLACGASLPAAVQRQLVRFLDRGGALLLAPMAPWLDEDFAPCPILAERLGLAPAAPRIATGAAPRAEIAGEADFPIMGSVVHIAPPAAGAQPLATIDSEPFAWRLAPPAGGAAILLGLQWTHQRHEHARMLTSLLGQLGLRRRLAGGDHRIWAVLRWNGDQAMLFALNLFTFPVRTGWTFVHPADGREVDTGPVTVPGSTVATWTAADGWTTLSIPEPA